MAYWPPSDRRLRCASNTATRGDEPARSIRANSIRSLRIIPAPRAGTPEGFTVVEAASGEDGLALARAGSIDAIVLDVLLPDLDGFEVAARLKADPATSGIPILVVTGHPLTDAEKARLNEHALAVLAKGDAALSGLLGWLDQVGGGQR